MEEYQKRVLIEQKELGEKIVFFLSAFLTDNDKVKELSGEEFTLLNHQCETMFEYNRMLQARILLFKENNNDKC